MSGSFAAKELARISIVLHAQFANHFREAIEPADPLGEAVDVAFDVGRER
jgi:hypothetical protein